MKTKLLFFYIFLIACLPSCNYLDIVPDETAKDVDVYQNEALAKSYLYMCYGCCPRRAGTDGMIEWRGRGIEYLTWEAAFTSVDYSPSAVAQNSYTWGRIWEGIRHCYRFLEVVDKTPNITQENLKYFKGEATFLIAYYHFISLQSYGPTCIVRKAFASDEEFDNLPERSSYDEVVAFINEKLDEAYPNLADAMPGSDFGRATKASVWAVKSRMRLYAASPLFNGNTMYADFKSKIDGRNLISQTYDPKKWETAAEVSEKAIQEVTALGYHLYGDAEAGNPDAAKPGPVDKAQRRIRYCFMDDAHPTEMLLAETRAETIYDMQARSTPRWTATGLFAPSNQVGPTLQMVEKFYTKNGLPIEEDKEFDYEGRYSVVPMPADYDGNNYPVPPAEVNRTTMSQHLNREPRFYAWVGFHNGFAETAKHNNAVVSTDHKKKAIILKITKNGQQGKQNRTNHFSHTGYLCKKFCHPAFEKDVKRYPFPVFRMTELYLNCAEALIETQKPENFAKAKEYINVVRRRAGVDDIDVAWKKAVHPEYANSYKGLQSIVRREREIEFYMEQQHFWDARRWMIAESELSEANRHKVLNIEGITEIDFFKVTNTPYPMQFNKGQYLMPIATGEINRMPQLVQNPFYD